MTQRAGSGSLVAAIVLSGLGVAGLSVGIWGISQILDDMDWVSVDAKVSKFEGVAYEYEGTRSGGGTYTATGTRVKVWYRFEANGKTFEGSRYSLLDPWDDYTKSTEAEAQRRLKVLERGHVSAWFDPDDPANAVLVRAERGAPFAVLAAGIILLGIGLWRFLAWRRRNSPDDDAWDDGWQET